MGSDISSDVLYLCNRFQGLGLTGLLRARGADFPTGGQPIPTKHSYEARTPGVA